MTAIEFLTRVPLRQEFVLLSSVLGVIVLVDALNNLPVGTASESSILGLFSPRTSRVKWCVAL